MEKVWRESENWEAQGQRSEGSRSSHLAGEEDIRMMSGLKDRLRRNPLTSGFPWSRRTYSLPPSPSDSLFHSLLLLWFFILVFYFGSPAAFGSKLK